MSHDIKKKTDGVAVFIGFLGILFSAVIAWAVHIFTWKELGPVMETVCTFATFGLGATLSLAAAFCVSFLEELREKVCRIEETFEKIEISSDKN